MADPHGTAVTAGAEITGAETAGSAPAVAAPAAGTGATTTGATGTVAIGTGPITGPTTELAVVEEELLVEEVSIDGMCGVY
jgi:mycofactocin precursor